MPRKFKEQNFNIIQKRDEVIAKDLHKRKVSEIMRKDSKWLISTRIEKMESQGKVARRHRGEVAVKRNKQIV